MDEVMFSELKTETSTTCNYKDGYWHVTQTVIQSRRNTGEEWQDREVTMSATATELHVALTNTLISIEYFLTKKNNDLFYDDDNPVPSRLEDGTYVN